MTPPPWAYSPVSAGVLQSLTCELERESLQTLRAAVDRVPAEVPVTSIFSRLPVRKALMKELGSGRYDLLVMGSRGRKAIRASLFGSVSHFALNHSPIPVMVIHADEPPTRPTPPVAEGGLAVDGGTQPGGAFSPA
jgi:nucleotide-binding universal stress UspA family protein